MLQKNGICKFIKKGGEKIMADLNKVAEALRRQRPIAVTRGGQLVEKPSDSQQVNSGGQGFSRLEPKKFYLDS